MVLGSSLQMFYCEMKRQAHKIVIKKIEQWNFQAEFFGFNIGKRSRKVLL